MKNRRFKQQMGRWGRNGLILKVSSNSGILILCMKQVLYTLALMARGRITFDSQGMKAVGMDCTQCASHSLRSV